MARVAAHTTAAMAGVQVVEAAFEDWPLPQLPFRLVVSAQAWHWIRPAVGFTKAHRTLAPGGSLALLWNTAVPAGSRLGVQRALDDVYCRLAPQLAQEARGEIEADRRGEIEESGLFADVQRDDYPWVITYTTDQYLGLLRTQSNHRLLDPGVLESLLDGVATVLAENANQLVQHYNATLYLAKRRG